MEAIPEKDLFMMCETLDPSALSAMPERYSVRLCREDEVDEWIALHVDDPSQQMEIETMMKEYFGRVYAKHGGLFFQRCLFACDERNRPVGTCFIWKAYGRVNTLHWLKVRKDQEGKGIGRSLLSHVMQTLSADAYPVFLHTHPSCFRAIKLYSDFGFAFLTDDRIGYRPNDLEECLPILSRVMPTSAYDRLRFIKAPQVFLDAAGSSEISEF